MYIDLVLKKSSSILFLIVLSLFQNVVAQNFADKEYYLVDSLEIDKISESDKQLIDSCLTFFHQATEDTTRLKRINTIVEESWDENVWPKYNLWVYHFTQQKLQEQPNKKTKRNLRIRLAGAINNIGYYQNKRGNTAEALKFYKKSLKIQEELNAKEGIATGLNNIGAIYKKQGDAPNALNYFHKSLKIYQGLENTKGIGQTFNNIGNIHQGQDDQNLAIEFFHKSLNIYKKLGDNRSEATLLNNIGFAYFKKGNREKALYYYNESILLRETVNDKRGLANTYNNIATVYEHEHEHDKAMDYYLKSNAIFKDLGYQPGLSTNSINIGRLLYNQNKLSEAKEFVLIGLELAEKQGSPSDIQRAAKLLSAIYGDEGKGMLAFEMHQLYTAMRDSVTSQKNQKAIIQQNAKYQYQKEKAIDDAERDNLIAIEKKEIEKQQIIISATVFGLLLVLLFSFIVFNKLKIARKQKLRIEVQNKEIVDSITYAKRIQEAILPSGAFFKKIFPLSFIYYKPKDIVAGDFYWLEVVKREHSTPNTQDSALVFFAVADCTGHGVPGAMVSVVCNNALNAAVREHKLTDPGEVLDKTREIVAHQFNKSQTTSISNIRDGMDIALCVLNTTTNIVKFAGAFNPLWILRNGSHELEELKATRQPIGKIDQPKLFKTSTAELKKGDQIYLFSDGYADQFGGKKGKKMMRNRFKEILISSKSASMDDQKTQLDSEFLKWKGELEQIDDVCVMGVKI